MSIHQLAQHARQPSTLVDAAIASGVGLWGYLQTSALGPVAQAIVGLVAAVLAAGASAFVSTYVRGRLDGQTRQQALKLAEAQAQLVVKTTALELAHEQIRGLGQEPVTAPKASPGS